MSFKMDREEYAQHYGPTVGDSVRLGDTNLFAAIEKVVELKLNAAEKEAFAKSAAAVHKTNAALADALK